MDPKPRIFRPILVFSSLLLAAAAAFALPAWVEKGGTNAPKKTTGPSGGESVKNAWKEVDRLVDEQKMEEAARRVDGILKTARAAGDEADWTRALVRSVQLRTALHGYETSVRFLREEAWPAGDLSRATLNLFYGHALVTYAHAYSWEIGRREKVASKGVVDLKAWTREEIDTEARKAYLEVWSRRERLGKESAARLAEYVAKNSYPEGIRSTLRDLVSYLFVEMLADTSSWRPEQSNELFRLDLGVLLSDAAPPAALDDPAVHPIAKIASILADLETWHAKAGRPEAALEARLERVRRLHASFTEESDRERIKSDLERRLPAFRSVSWWSMGQAELAEMTSAEPGAKSLVVARAIAEEGRKAFPTSVGGKRCLSIVKTIEAPEVSFTAMLSDGPRRRSFEVKHRNLAALHFRAYTVDVAKRLAAARDYNLMPSAEEMKKLLGSRRPVAEWTAELPPTSDFRDHRTFVAPPLDGPGAYAVVASAKADFPTEDNRLLGTLVFVTDLVLTSRREDDGLHVTAFSGATGNPVAGASVELWAYDWNEGHRRVATATTDDGGDAAFGAGDVRSGHAHFLFARKGADLALDPSYYSYYRPNPPGERRASLVYTDRSVYRPLQKLFWKAVAYRGSEDRTRYAVRPNATLSVSLVDPNGQKVETKTVVTNAFGSAAGEFAIPTGRLLGAWRVEVEAEGAAHVKVEEYKRPTFEAELKEPEETLRLNRPAKLRGEVKYYFGLPVTSGAVKWRVTREPVYPWWWGWFWTAPPTKTQTVATGTAALDEKGTFTLSFTPAADERKSADPEKAKGVSYRFVVSADVTDEGGETRSASRAFRLGLVTVEARLDLPTGFVLDGTSSEVAVTRTDLDGTPRPGKATFRLLSLRQPDRALLPAEVPSTADAAPGADPAARAFETPGDRLRPRWAAADALEKTLRSWKDGAEVRSGPLTHDAKGRATIALEKLPLGAYRVRYETVDPFGATYEATKDFVVAGKSAALAVPAVLVAEDGSVAVGGTARFLVHSALPDQPLFFDVFRNGALAERRRLRSGEAPSLVEIPVRESDRGGFGVALTAVRDHQLLRSSASVHVPWDDRQLSLAFSTFRDTTRPGGRETWRVTATGADGKTLAAGAAELLAYMYDKSLDVFGPHSPPSPLGLYPWRASVGSVGSTLSHRGADRLTYGPFAEVPAAPSLTPDRLVFFDAYGIGGPGARFGRRLYKAASATDRQRNQSAVGGLEGGVASGIVGGMPGSLPATAEAPAAAPAPPEVDLLSEKKRVDRNEVAAAPAPESVPLRSDFAETAFWLPQLLTDADGSVTLEFTVPDSVTAWNVWVHAVTKDLRSGSLRRESRSVKELMVRPYLPRFLREGDAAELKVVVNNASEKELSGTLALAVDDPEMGRSLLSEFGVSAPSRSFRVPAGGGTNLTFRLATPKRVGLAAFKVTATSGDVSDGELRTLPVLPSRMHLAQSRFVTLRGASRKTLHFADLAKDDDPTRTNEELVVTVDAQLFYQVLSALPYLVNYPYECTEQTLNRFVSTGIVSSLYRDYPAVARMAEQMKTRETPLETWDAADANRKMALEETPWLEEAKGGKDAGWGLTNVLDPRVAKADRDASLLKLRKAQTAVGGFPWWPGGPPSPYMTVYLLHGFAKAAEFGVDVPKDMVQKAWAYVAQHYRSDLHACMAKGGCVELLTFVNYVASAFPDESWRGGALSDAERTEILDFSFRKWKEHSPYLKGYLALTLQRAKRAADARLVWDSVMDSAKTSEELGTYWAQEDRSWLWYRDTIESHAFSLRTLMELSPKDARRDGLVQWLLLNKKLNQWKSTRATAEVIYSLVHYLKAEGALGIREDATVTVGPQRVSFVFEPDRFTGKKNQVVVPGEKVDPKTSSTVVVEKESKGFAFASATWRFATDRMPEEGSGDFFEVKRTYFKRENTGREWVLSPLAEGAVLAPGDQVEVQLSLRAKHEAEYVHLRDPRAAGLEPENAVSRYRWDLGVGCYEEIRDSGSNFFFERLPVGEYTFKYRLRANLAGTFRVGPATVQSMYAPEFHAYSAGHVLRIGEERKK